MLTANHIHFIILDIAVLCVLAVSVSNGWANGCLRAVSDFLVSIFKIAVSALGGSGLSKVFILIPEDQIHKFLLRRLNYLTGVPDPDWVKLEQIKDPQLLPAVCRLVSFLIYFIVIFILLSSVERVWMRKRRNREKAKEKKLSVPDRILGALLGLFLFLVCTIMPCPFLISSQAMSVVSNGKDCVYKTLFAIPVNYAARPLTRMAWGEETDRVFWEEKGVLIFEKDVSDFGNDLEKYGIEKQQ